MRRLEIRSELWADCVGEILFQSTTSHRVHRSLRIINLSHFSLDSIKNQNMTIPPSLPPNMEPSKLRNRPTLAECDSIVADYPVKKRIVDLEVTRAAIPIAQCDFNIVDLNRTAIALFMSGDLLSAELHFLRAFILSHSSSFSFDAVKKWTQSDELPTSCYMYQRMDFDEGMAAFKDPEYILYEDHPLAVRAKLLYNIGQVKSKQCDFIGASLCFESALEVLIPSIDLTREALFFGYLNLSCGIAQNIIIQILHCLGLSAYRKGKLAEAETIYRLALLHTQAIKGPEDCITGVTLNCLGVLYYHLASDNANSAVELFADAHRIVSKALGPRNACVATILNNMGRAMIPRDNPAAALRYYEEALAIRRDCLGANHIDYAATAFNAGQSLHQLGCYDRAGVLYKEFLRVATEKFSRTHRDIAVVLSGIAQIHQKRKEYAKAREMHEESLRVGRAALGNKHAEIAMLLNRVGNFYFEREDYHAALKAYKEGLSIEREVLGKSHPNIIVTLSNIGEIHRQRRHFSRAVSVYFEAMELQKNRHGDISEEVAGTLNTIGLIYDQQGNSDEALLKLQEALVMRRTILGDDHLDVAATLTHLGTLFYRRSMITTAQNLFAESFRIRRATLGSDHRDVSFSLYNIGLCHQLQGEHKDAIECFQETLRIEKLVFGGNHRDVALTHAKLGEAFKANGDLDEALRHFMDALFIEKGLGDHQDPISIAKLLNEIGNIYLARGNVEQMMKNFAEAARIFRQEGRSFSSLTVSPVLKLYAAGFGACASAA